MRFDVVVGNPPYQKESGGIRPKEIYSDFIIKAVDICRDKCCLITPTRWYNGSTPNMERVRQRLLGKNTSIIVDYQKAEDVFENTQISGGISYWLLDKNIEVESCTVKHIVHDEVTVFQEKLNNEVFIRYKEGLSILNKVSKFNEFKLNGTYGFWKTFGNIHINDIFNEKGKIKFVARTGDISYLDEDYISADMIDIVPKYKVVTGAMTPGGGVQKADRYTVINTPRIIEPYEIFSDYYYTLGVFENLVEAENFVSYITTKFARVLIQLINNTTSFNQSKFKHIPIQDWSKTWSDEKLYEKYGLDACEISFIDSLIKEIKVDKVCKEQSSQIISNFEEFMNKPEV